MALDTDTYPPIAYLNDVSHDVIRVVHEYNEQKGEVVAAYTFDAGPNAVIYTTEAQVIPPLPSLFTLLRPYLAHFFPVFLVFCAFSPSRRGGSNEPQAGTQGQETAGKGPKR